MNLRRLAFICLLLLLAFAAGAAAQTGPAAAPVTSIIRLDPRFDQLVPKDTKIELVADDIIWAEGPVWDKQGKFLLFSDAPRNSAYKWSTKEGKFITLVDRYHGKRLNSPNDLVYKSNGDLYFTDPPYGLPKTFDDPARELPYAGVYRLGKDGKITLLTSENKAPNGIAFSPD